MKMFFHLSALASTFSLAAATITPPMGNGGTVIGDGNGNFRAFLWAANDLGGSAPRVGFVGPDNFLSEAIWDANSGWSSKEFSTIPRYELLLAPRQG